MFSLDVMVALLPQCGHVTRIVTPSNLNLDTVIIYSHMYVANLNIKMYFRPPKYHQLLSTAFSFTFCIPPFEMLRHFAL